MELSEMYFLAAAEANSISKAAASAYISQQSMSEHIKKVEEKYGTKLFERHPHLKLTPAGELLARKLKQIKLLEDSTRYELGQLNMAGKRMLRVGMHTMRARMLMPVVFPEFYKQHPDIILSVIHGEASMLESRMLSGELDLFLGINTSLDSRLASQTICVRPVRILLSENLRRQYIPQWQPGEEMNPELVKNLPFILSHEDSRVYQMVERFFKPRGISLNGIMYINNSENYPEFAAIDLGAAFVSETLNEHKGIGFSGQPDNPLYVAKIAGMNESSCFEIVTFKDMELSDYAVDFIEILKNALILWNEG